MSNNSKHSAPAGTNTPTEQEAYNIWLKIGLLSFGGPAAQISLMHRFIVEERVWLTEKQFLNALSFCMLLPGPEAMQLATYAGWRLQGIRGGLVAGLLFVLPGALVIALLATIYVYFGKLPAIDALFLGVKAAVIIVVIEALLRVSKRALATPWHWLIACAAFILIFFFNISYPLIVLGSAMLGFWLLPVKEPTPSLPANTSVGNATTYRSTLSTVSLFLCLCSAPLLLLWALAPQSVLLDIGLFFSRLAVVTFGGAYAVLAYLAQDVVTGFGWLSTGEMMDGLGLAETTPGPLILVTEFVGFIAGFRDSGLLTGFAAALITLWVTFVPCFLWIFAGAPYIDWLCAQPRLTGALSAITAAVVGVILNLSVWFALHVLFSTVTAVQHGPLTLWWPELNTLDWRVTVLTLISGIALLGLHWNIVKVLALASALGLLTLWL
ncbi:chromate transporter [Chromatiales bacterium (ex Bugula neritina AB1)]|nr:chromate transporter [Chromatiales bacterium (ex Bugula neritina AB1)]